MYTIVYKILLCRYSKKLPGEGMVTCVHISIELPDMHFDALIIFLKSFIEFF